MISRKFLVGAMVTVGGAILAARKLAADKDLRNDTKEKGKKLVSDAEDFINSVGAVAKDTTDKAVKEGRKILDEFKEAAEEAKEQLRHENEESATDEDVPNEEKANGENVTEDASEEEVNNKENEEAL